MWLSWLGVILQNERSLVDSWLGCMPGLQVQSSVGAKHERQPIDVSHNDISLPLFLDVPLCLKINF